MKTTQEENSAIRSDVLTTLAIAALIHDTDEGVRACAKRLIPYAPRSVCKNTLYPLSESHEALDIILEEVVYPTQEMVIGSAWRSRYEYELVVTYRESLSYDVETMSNMIIQRFMVMGITKGKLKMSFRFLFKRGYYELTVDMAQMAHLSSLRRNAA